MSSVRCLKCWKSFKIWHERRPRTTTTNDDHECSPQKSMNKNIFDYEFLAFCFLSDHLAFFFPPSLFSSSPFVCLSSLVFPLSPLSPLSGWGEESFHSSSAAPPPQPSPPAALSPTAPLFISSTPPIHSSIHRLHSSPLNSTQLPLNSTQPADPEKARGESTARCNPVRRARSSALQGWGVALVLEEEEEEELLWTVLMVVVVVLGLLSVHVRLKEKK